MLCCSPANLQLVQSGEITIVPEGLNDRWKLIHGYFIGPGAGLSRADLTRVNRTGAALCVLDRDLDGTIFDNTTTPEGSIKNTTT